MAQIAITAVVPTFNRKYCLPRALDSILGQSEPVDEVIVVDDGSDDGTYELVRESYRNIIYVAQENQGVSGARNSGIRIAENPWIAFLDSDDAWLPDKIERQKIALGADRSARLCHGNEIWIRNGSRVNAPDRYKKSGGWIFKECLPLCAISPSSAIIHREIFDAVGHFDESLPACEDYDLWLRICCRYPVLLIDDPVVEKYGGNPDQLSRQWGLDRYRIQALENIVTSGLLRPDDDRAARNVLREKCAVYADGAEKRGRAREAAAYRERAPVLRYPYQ